MGQNDQGLKSGKRRYQTVPRVLVFLRNGDDVLLLKGAPDKRIWANLYNGVGGHVEVDEDVFGAARREVSEETGLNVAALSLAAVANIDAGDPELGIIMFVFVGWSASRETSASYEGALHWAPVDRLPKAELVEDLEWLLPRVLRSKPGDSPIFLHYSYDAGDRLVIRTAE
jgi:8-oxo-dGTP diphosphatase